MTRDELKQIFKVLKNLFPQFEVTTEKLDVWHEFFNNQSHESVMENLKQYALGNKFPPTVADLTTVSATINSKSDFRDMEIEFQQWISDGGDPELFDWRTGGVTKH